jgi:hypothetical protein
MAKVKSFTLIGGSAYRNDLEELSHKDEKKIHFGLEDYGFKHKAFTPDREHGIVMKQSDNDVITERGLTFTLCEEIFKIGGGREQYSKLNYRKNIEYMAEAITKLVPSIEFGEVVVKEMDKDDREFVMELDVDIYGELYRLESTTHKLILEYIFAYDTTYLKEEDENGDMSIAFYEYPCVRLLLRVNTEFKDKNINYRFRQVGKLMEGF